MRRSPRASTMKRHGDSPTDPSGRSEFCSFTRSVGRSLQQEVTRLIRVGSAREVIHAARSTIHDPRSAIRGSAICPFTTGSAASGFRLTPRTGGPSADSPRRGSPGPDAADVLHRVAQDIAGTLRSRELRDGRQIDLREAVEQVPGGLPRLDRGTRTQYGIRVQEGVAVPRRLEGEHDARVTFDVAHLQIPPNVTAQDVVAVKTDPDHGDLRGAVSVDRTQVDQRTRLDQLSQLAGKAAHGFVLSPVVSATTRQPSFAIIVHPRLGRSDRSRAEAGCRSSHPGLSSRTTRERLA